MLRRQCCRLPQDRGLQTHPGRGRLSPAELRDGGRGVPGAMAAGYLEGCAYIAGLTEGLSSAMGPKAGLRGQGLRRSLEGTQASGWAWPCLIGRAAQVCCPGRPSLTPLPRTLCTGFCATSSENRSPSPTAAYLRAHLHPQMKGLPGSRVQGLLPRRRT